MEKKFIKLMESNITRATRGGFLVGDYIEFIKGYKSNKAFKELNDPVKDAIEDLIKSKLNLRIIGVNDTTSMRYSGNPDMMNGLVTLSISADHGGGRNYGNVLVPSCLCKILDNYPNLTPFPDQFNYDNKEIHKPEEVKLVDSGAKGISYGLPSKNIPLKDSKPSKKKVQKESYTAQYLTGM